MSGGDHIIVLTHDDTAALMAAVADLEQAFPYSTRVTGAVADAIVTLSRVASIIDEQVSTQ